MNADKPRLTSDEQAKVNGARNEAMYRAARYADDNAGPFPFECGRVAAHVALRVALARRTRAAEYDRAYEAALKVADSLMLSAGDASAFAEQQAEAAVSWYDDGPEPFEPSDADRRWWSSHSNQPAANRYTFDRSTAELLSDGNPA